MELTLNIVGPAIPKALEEFQRVFPDDATCAKFLEQLRWPEGFVCSKCGNVGEPYRFTKRKTVVLRCRACQANTSLTTGTVMQQSHMPLTIWFWGTYLVVTQNPGMTTAQFQEKLGLHYKTASHILRKLRAAMARPSGDPIGARFPVEVDVTLIGEYTKRKGHSAHHKSLLFVAGAVEVRTWESGAKGKKRMKATGPGRLQLRLIADRSAKALTEFVQENVAAGAVVRTDGWSGFDGLAKLGYTHESMELDGDDEKIYANLPIIHLAFSNLKAWLRDTHNGVSPNNLQDRLNEFSFRFNHIYYPPKDAIQRESAQLLLLP